MLNEEELQKISHYLDYLVCEAKNRFTVKQEVEILKLAKRCREEIKEVETQERAYDVYFGRENL